LIINTYGFRTCHSFLTPHERIFRLRLQISANRQRFEELRKSGKYDQCRACIRRDRFLRKRLERMEKERLGSQS
jgi:hypothetical protein